MARTFSQLKTQPTLARQALLALTGICAIGAIGLSAGMRGLSWQSASVTITGTIRSSSGKPVAGARLTLTNEGNAAAQSVSSSESGEYVFASIASGAYTLAVDAPGFESATRRHIAVNAMDPTRVDFTLAPADPAGSISTRPSYDDSTPMKPSAVNGTVDAGGYSSPGEARTSTRLLKGVAGMKRRASNAGIGAGNGIVEMDSSVRAIMEAQLKRETEISPKSYEANHKLGEFYLAVGNSAAAIPCLDAAWQIDASHYDNGYDLALAYVDTHQPLKAREQLRQLMARQDSADLHSLLAEVEEATGQYGTAAHEFERAARMDPSEDNIFGWGSELLVHRAFDPAIQVFTNGVERYPGSATLKIGYGVALYSRGRYEESIKTLCAAADLAPADPRPYLFLGKMYNVSAPSADQIPRRLEFFVKAQPQNAQAMFYYAMSLWKGQRPGSDSAKPQQIESLLAQSIALDSKFAEAYFQLGNLFADQKELSKAVKNYKQAIALQSDLLEAHYRLAQAYTRTGEKGLAQQELELHDRLRKQQVAESDRQRGEIQGFVDSLKENPKP